MCKRDWLSVTCVCTINWGEECAQEHSASGRLTGNESLQILQLDSYRRYDLSLTFGEYRDPIRVEKVAPR